MAEQVPELERAKRLINKLLDRTSERGFTEAEAMDASAKVTALLEQFDLTLDEVVMRDERCVKREVYAAFDSMAGVAHGIARLCSLKSYRDTGKTGIVYVWFGFERDMELALFLWEVITEAFSTEWAVFTKEHGFARKTRESFEMGFGERIRTRLTEMREHRDAEAMARMPKSGSTSLVFVRDGLVDEEFEKTGVKLRLMPAKRVHDPSAYWKGDAAGARVQIHTPVNGEAKSLLD
jgi:hypothetical protein